MSFENPTNNFEEDPLLEHDEPFDDVLDEFSIGDEEDEDEVEMDRYGEEDDF